jgi:hypothetical protein
MAKESKTLEVLNAQTKQAFEETKQATELLKETVEETKAQALSAVDTYFVFLNRAISSLPSAGTEFGDKLKELYRENIVTTHQFVRQLYGDERARHARLGLAVSWNRAAAAFLSQATVGGDQRNCRGWGV